MSQPWPNPPQIPPIPRADAVQVGTATYGAPRYCQRCGRPADVFDVDGCWCSPAHQAADRLAVTR